MFLQFLFLFFLHAFTCLKEIVYLWCSASVRNSAIHGEYFIFLILFLHIQRVLQLLLIALTQLLLLRLRYRYCERVEWIKVSAFLFNKRMDGCIIRKNEEILSERVRDSAKRMFQYLFGISVVQANILS